MISSDEAYELIGKVMKLPKDAKKIVIILEREKAAIIRTTSYLGKRKRNHFDLGKEVAEALDRNNKRCDDLLVDARLRYDHAAYNLCFGDPIETNAYYMS